MSARNAGVGIGGMIESLETKKLDMQLDVNLRAVYLTTQKAIPMLKESRNASIANLSSAAGRFGFPLRAPYAASKWGVIGFTKTLAIELGGFGVRVNALCPGSVAGARIDSVFANKAAAPSMVTNGSSASP